MLFHELGHTEIKQMWKRITQNTCFLHVLCNHQYSQGKAAAANNIPWTQCVIACTPRTRPTCMFNRSWNIFNMSLKIIICHSLFSFILFYFSCAVLLFCSLTALDLRVGHTMKVLSPFISVLCHFDWLFHGESCPCVDVVHPGHAWSSSPACTWHCSLHHLFLQATPLHLKFMCKT